jgi:hypothetical protein
MKYFPIVTSIAMLTFVLSIGLYFRLEDKILSRFVEVGAVYEKCYDYTTPFKEGPVKCCKKKVLAIKDGYIQYEIVESDWWIEPVGKIGAEEAAYFHQSWDRVE